MNLFYSKNTTINHNEIVILDQENRHLTKVLRKKTGDTIYVTNGEGVLFDCIIEDSNKNKSVLRVQNYSTFNNNLPRLKIGISLTKKTDRFEWFLEKATEIGVSEITPIICKNSERNKFNFDRSTKMLLSAMKQSLQYKLPTLNKPISFLDYISKVDDSYDSYIATCIIDGLDLFNRKLYKGNNSEVLIGPEGGFTLNEIDLAKKANFVPVSIGKNRLRTETAGVVVCSTFSNIN
ncbi:MAG: 16S rRNA (uracil(1498)-N(3))-methyltransferase [Flavobacteriaceae bacterium]|nr:16S rRNA (uracil(1498)-N(3))-methyltransferase [Flavobacteriaceae bacterium]|tara:strand:+ start:1112 stop:1816 length:705 start_codon:yes stop_codon:yes gene_type:complete